MDQCYIWKTPITYPQDSDGDNVYVESPRAGGKYKITGTAASTIDNLTVGERTRLTTWLCDQRHAGVEYPVITDGVVTAAKSFRPLSTVERLERVLVHFNQFSLGRRIQISSKSEFMPEEHEAPVLAALGECESKDELLALVDFMVQMGWLSVPQSTLQSRWLTATAQGWLKIDELIKKLPSSTQAFVAMWFNDSMAAAFTDGIEPAIRDSGYEAVRIDKKEHNNKIDDAIIAEIRRSKFVVADFTCEKEKVRGGVYFEAGFAMGLGIPVIWTCSKGSFEYVHFDTRQYNHIVWDTPLTLRKLLTARIGAVIGDGPLKSS